MLITLGVSGLAVAFAGRTLEKYREPSRVALEDLEAGARPPSIHVVLDEHWEVRDEYGIHGEDKASTTMCFPLLSTQALSSSEVGDKDPGQWSTATREAIQQARAFVVTSRYSGPDAISVVAERVPGLRGMVRRKSSACEALWQKWGIKGTDLVIIKEGEGPTPMPFIPFAAAALVCLLAAPVPIVQALRKGPPLSAYPSGPPQSLHPPSTAPPVSFGPGSRVLVRRREEMIEATVIALEPGRCRCEF